MSSCELHFDFETSEPGGRPAAITFLVQDQPQCGRLPPHAGVGLALAQVFGLLKLRHAAAADVDIQAKPPCKVERKGGRTAHAESQIVKTIVGMRYRSKETEGRDWIKAPFYNKDEPRIVPTSLSVGVIATLLTIEGRNGHEQLLLNTALLEPKAIRFNSGGRELSLEWIRSWLEFHHLLTDNDSVQPPLHRALTARSPAADMDDFWTQLTPYGTIHRADRASPKYAPGVAFVFVHGNVANADMWTDVWVRGLLNAIKVDADVMACAYPAEFFDIGSNPTAAKHLATEIRNQLAGDQMGRVTDYRHFIFVSHSNGGLVVKRLLTSEAEDWIEKTKVGGAPAGDLDAPGAIAHRTRCVAFVAAAQELGAEEELRALEKQFRATRQRLRDQDSPVPHIIDIIDITGDQDKYAGGAVLDGEQIEFRAQHFFNTFSSQEAPHALLARRLSGFARLTPWTIAERTMERTREAAAALGVRELIGPRAKASSGGQQSVFQYLRAECGPRGVFGRRFIVTGAPGVGKSRMLSRLAQSLAAERLSDLTGRAPSVMFIPAGRLRMAEHARAEVEGMRARKGGDVARPSPEDVTMTQSALLTATAALATAYGGLPHVYTADTLRETLRNERYVVIVDGLDEFLAYHPFVGWSELVEAIRTLPAPAEMGHTIIVGVRKGQRGATDLVGGEWEGCEVALMTMDEVERYAPGAGKIIEGVKSRPIPGVKVEEAVDLLRTPLLTLRLGQQAGDFLAQADHGAPGTLVPGSITHVLDFCLKQILRGAADTQPPGALADIDTCMNALTLIARAYYVDHEPLLSVDDIRTRIERLRTVWTTRDGRGYGEFRSALDALPGPPDSPADAEKDRFLDGIMTTVFQDVASGLWAFAHDTWRSFLNARYYARCVRHENIDELGLAGFVPFVTGMAGHFMNGWEPSRTFVHDARLRSRGSQPWVDRVTRVTDALSTTGAGGDPDPTPAAALPEPARSAVAAAGASEGSGRAEEVNNLLYICNCLAVVIWNPTARINDPVLKEFLSCAADERHCSLSRVFVLNGLCFRVAEAGRIFPPEEAGWAGHIANTLGVCAGGKDPIVASLASAYLSALDVQNGGAAAPRSALRIEDMRLARSAWDFGPDGEAKQATLQRSVCPLLPLTLQLYESRRVAGAHYLFFLRAIEESLNATPATRALLQEVFGSHSEYRKRFHAERAVGHLASEAPAVPMLADLFDLCDPRTRRRAGGRA